VYFVDSETQWIFDCSFWCFIKIDISIYLLNKYIILVLIVDFYNKIKIIYVGNSLKPDLNEQYIK